MTSSTSPSSWAAPLIVACLCSILNCSDDSQDTDAQAKSTTSSSTTQISSTQTTSTTAMSTSSGSGSTTTPSVETPLSIPSLSAPVQVRFDTHGVVHLNCQTNADCFAAQGYYHAADRFAQMDIHRRAGRGRIASMLILSHPQVMEIDLSMRRLLTTRDGLPLEEAGYAALDQETKGAVDAYTRGVNAWLADMRAKRHGAKLHDEYGSFVVNRDQIPAWEPEDTMAVGLVFLNGLTNNSPAKLGAALMLDNLAGNPSNPDPDGLGLFQDLHKGWHIDPDSVVMRTGGGKPFIKLGDLSPLPWSPDMRHAQARLAPHTKALRQALSVFKGLPDFQKDRSFGSNAWATSPARNDGDWATLANDPHLPLTNPALWHLFSIDAKTQGQGDLHAAGVSFPGVPGIFLGHGEHVSWGATVAFWDLIDVYDETLSDDGEGVMFQGPGDEEPRKVPFIKRTYEFPQPGGQIETRELLFVPHHGPVLSIDREAGSAVTFKTVMADQTEDMAVFINLGRVKDLKQAREVLTKSTAAGFSFTLIDRQGHIAYYPFAGIPRRGWKDMAAYPPALPLPGTGGYEWEGLIRADELPQMEDPPSGFFLSANGGITDDMIDGVPGNEGTPPLQTVYRAEGVRQARILDVLETQTKMSWQDHFALQGDTYSWIAAKLLPVLLDGLDRAALRPLTAQLLARLEAWDYTCPTGLEGHAPDAAPAAGPSADASVGCAAFHVFVSILTHDTIADSTGLRGSEDTFSQRLGFLYVLTLNPEKLDQTAQFYWDDETTDARLESQADAVAKALDEAADTLTKKFGSAEPDQWRWGRIHTLTMAAQLLSLITPDFNAGPFASPGGALTVNVADPHPGDGRGDYTHTDGASMRMVVEGRAEGFVSRFQLAGGQVSLSDSPLYNSLLDEWLENKPFQMPFSPQEVEREAVRTLEVVPTP